MRARCAGIWSGHRRKSREFFRTAQGDLFPVRGPMTQRHRD